MHWAFYLHEFRPPQGIILGHLKAYLDLFSDQFQGSFWCFRFIEGPLFKIHFLCLLFQVNLWYIQEKISSKFMEKWPTIFLLSLYVVIQIQRMFYRPFQMRE